MMKKFIIIILFSIIFIKPIFSKEFFCRFGLSLNYPGVGVKFVLKKNLLELKYQISNDESYQSNLFGTRYYRYFSRTTIYYYAGLEASYFNTKTNSGNLESTGYILGSFGGIEKFLYKNISINLDIGPYFAQATINNFSATEFDFVLNIAVNLYFWEKK